MPLYFNIFKNLFIMVTYEQLLLLPRQQKK